MASLRLKEWREPWSLLLFDEYLNFVTTYFLFVIYWPGIYLALGLIKNHHSMKISVLALFLLSFYFSTKAQTMTDLNKRISEIEDRIAIKNVVDTFSVLADRIANTKTNAAFHGKYNA